MKFLSALFVLLLAGSVSAQCPNGACALPQGVLPQRYYSAPAPVKPSQPAQRVYVAPPVSAPVYRSAPVYVAPRTYYAPPVRYYYVPQARYYSNAPVYRSYSSGSCANGSCSMPARRGFFRRW